MNTRKLVLITLILFSSSIAMAQYDFAVGLRSGGTSGLTLKKITEVQQLKESLDFGHMVLA